MTSTAFPPFRQTIHAGGLRTLGPSRFRSGFLAVCLLLFGGMNTHAALPGEPTDWYYLLLEGEPASAGFLRSRDQAGQEAAIASARARAAEIADQHEALGERLRALNVTEAGRFCRLVNAVRVKTPPSQLPALRALPGVRRVERIRRHERHTSTSVPFIGATALWSGTPAADGMGVRIGIVDSGIDYTHAHFGGSGQTNDYVENDPTQIESGTFPTAKVSGGFDFVGDDYNAEDPSRDFPQPDPDPLDCAANGHGTHVAGIAAGFGVLANGTTYTGPYTSGLNLSGFAIGPGVAPNGLLYALKVFGCSGTTRALVDALEYASDPDGDFDFSDRLDVVNVSLGSPFGLATPEDAERNALNQLVDLGCVVVTSAGNTGEPFYSLSSPGVAEKGLTVANSIDDGTTTLGVEVLSPEPIAAIYDAIEGIFTSPLAEQPPIEAELVWVEPGDACESISNPAALAGKVALIDRGTCLFVDKIQRAQDAGAVAVVMVNNVSGAPIAMGGSSSTITIPGVMISQADGALIKEYLSGAPVVRLSMDTVRIRAELADQLDGSSSRGPSSPGNQLKPEIAAPGHSITSAQAGAGGLGEMMTGTSMAAPHVAGAAALLRQLHPEWLVEDIKAALMNTAQPTRDAAGHPYPQSRTGAGRVQPEAAARAVVTAKAAGAAGLVAMSFGALELTAPHIETRNVVLVNHGSQPVSYTVTVTNSIVENGVALTPLVSSVTVPANGSINVPVQLTANPAMFDRTSDPTTAGEIGGLPRHTLFEASGEIWFLNPNLSIHLPFYVNVRAAAAFSAATPALAVPFTAGPAILALPMSGASAHPQALISAFQLGAISGDQSLTAPQRQGVDLLAVGAASDIGTKAQLEDATVYFGIGVVGNRTTPVGFMGDFYVLIDTNYDGTADCWLENFSAGNNGDDLYTAESANDVFMTVLSQESTSVTNSFLNVFPADQRDTAPFNNGVMVMPVTVKALGLTPGRSGFRYRVVAYGAQEERYPLVDETDWIDFDAARPLVDTAVYGMGGTPFFDAGPDVRVRVDRTAAAFNGFTDPEPADLLLLHHFNTVGNRVEVVDAQYTPRFLPPEIQPNGIVLSWPSASNQLFTIRYTTQLGAPFGFVAGANLPATPPVNTMLLDTSSGDPVRLFRLEWQ